LPPRAIVRLLVATAYAEADEIHVYDADINSAGEFNLQCATTTRWSEL
jgi:hypothetical protein